MADFDFTLAGTPRRRKEGGGRVPRGRKGRRVYGYVAKNIAEWIETQGNMHAVVSDILEAAYKAAHPKD